MESLTLNELLVKDYNLNHTESLTQKQIKQYIGNAYLLIYSIIDYKHPDKRRDFLENIKRICMDIIDTPHEIDAFLFEYYGYCKMHPDTSVGNQYCNTLDITTYKTNINDISLSILNRSDIQDEIFRLLGVEPVMFERIKKVFARPSNSEPSIEKATTTNQHIESKDVFRQSEITSEQVSAAIDYCLQNGLSQEESQKLIEQERMKALPWCYAIDLKNSDIVFVRVTKSSPDVANASAEKHPMVEAKEHKVTRAHSANSVLSCTVESNLLTCLRYGDLIAYISFNEQDLRDAGLENEKVYRIGSHLNEYTSNAFYIGKILDLQFPETLRDIVAKADINVLSRTIQNDITLNGHEVMQYLQAFHLTDTANAWGNVLSVFQQYHNPYESGINTAKFIQDNIEKIIPTISLEEKLNNLDSDGLLTNDATHFLKDIDR